MTTTKAAGSPGVYLQAEPTSGAPELWIYDEIGGFGGVSAQSVSELLQSVPRDAELHVRVNSPGGSAFDGIAIYNLLHQRPGRVVVSVDGMALSAASVVAMAGDEIKMAENAMLMIHDPWAVTIGGAEDHVEAASRLDKIGATIATTYAARTGMNREEVAALMAAETWFTAEDAIEAGFATEITPAKTASASLRVPESFRNRYRNTPPVLALSASHTAAPEFPAQAPADKDTPDMPFPTQLLSALALEAEATEAEVVESAQALACAVTHAGDFITKIQALTNSESADEALGIVRAWQSSHEQLPVVQSRVDELEAENDELKAEREGRERDALIARGRAERKLTPALVAHFTETDDEGRAKRSPAELAAFLAVAPQVIPGSVDEPAAAGQGDEPAVTTPDGKRWEDLSPQQKHDIYHTDRALYSALQNDFARRNAR